MNRHFFTALIAFLIAGLLHTRVAFAVPGDVSLVTPSVTCPQTQLGDEKLQAHYDALWMAYSEKVAATSKTVEDELSRLYETARSAGNLDLALFWSAMKKSFAEMGELRWEPTKQKKDWKRFGDSDFPEGLAAILSKCDAEYDKSRDALEAGYKTLETELTKADKLEQALTMRAEFKRLWGGAPTPPLVPPKPDLVNLLDGIDITAGRTHECWSMEGNRLKCSSEGNPAFSAFTFHNPQVQTLAKKGEYDVNLEVTLKIPREKFGTDFIVAIPGVPGRPSLWLRHYWGHKQSKVMLWGSREFQVNGVSQPSVEVPCPFQLDESNKVLVGIRVRNKGRKVIVLLNGRKVIDCDEFPARPSSEDLKLSVSLKTELTVSGLTISDAKK